MWLAFPALIRIGVGSFRGTNLLVVLHECLLVPLIGIRFGVLVDWIVVSYCLLVPFCLMWLIQHFGSQLRHRWVVSVCMRMSYRVSLGVMEIWVISSSIMFFFLMFSAIADRFHLISWISWSWSISSIRQFVIKLILISPESQLLTDDKAQDIRLNFKTRKQRSKISLLIGIHSHIDGEFWES